MDANAKKKKALELMAQRRPAPAMPSAPGGNAPSAAPSVASRFADVMARRKAGKK